jgi:hypothetical protein
MSELAPATDSLDLAQIDDPQLRRAMRQLQQQLAATVAHQQAEIDALLEVLLEKHVTSMGEFKRVLARLQQDPARARRLKVTP